MLEECVVCKADLAASERLEGRDRFYRLTYEVSQVAICPNCSAGTSLPVRTDAELAAYYPAEYSAYQAPRAGFARRAMERVIVARQRRMLRAAPFDALDGTPRRLLDVGCGRGDIGAALVAAGWSVDGVEPSAHACAVARERGVNAIEGGWTANTQSTLEEGDAVRTGGYDCILFSHSLEHLASPAEAMRMAAALVRPGGTLIVSVPNFDSWQRRRFGSAWFHLDLPRHRTHFSAGALRRVAEDAGFEVVSMSTTTSAVGLPGSLQYRIFGKCLFRGGIMFYIANALAVAARPFSALADRIAHSGGDFLHMVARH